MFKNHVKTIYPDVSVCLNFYITITTVGWWDVSVGLSPLKTYDPTASYITFSMTCAKKNMGNEVDLFILIVYTYINEMDLLIMFIYI